MNQYPEVQGIDDYVQSLNDRSEGIKKKFSFWKVFFAILICLLVIVMNFRGENAIQFFFSGWVPESKAEKNTETNYLCDEQETVNANILKPKETQEYYASENTILLVKKDDLDKRRKEISNELDMLEKMSEGAEKKSRTAEIDAKLDRYNSDVGVFNDSYDNYRSRLLSFNERVKVYNEYLEHNCKD
ncbi:MAG: hypothetical protein PHW52_02570 [Candidatus Pacebacteria bacterium]|nr:hypothetical protein [Candidatus Paceibacterota bacterium]